MILNEHIHTTREKELFDIPLVRLGLLLVGIGIAFLAMDIMLRRPLLRELAHIKHDLATVEGRLQELTGAKDQAWETSNLLSALNAQKRQLTTAKAALADLREFRQHVEIEARKTSDAAAAMTQIADLQQQIRGAAQNAETAAIEVAKLGDLRTKVLENSAGIEVAQRNAADLLTLKETIRQGDDVASAQHAADQLVALKNSLQPADDSTEQSQAHATKLLSLRDEMAATVEDTRLAARNWSQMRKLETDMRSAGGDIANAVDTLELLTDLSAELRQQTESITGLRKSVMEIVLLETTIGRALRVLEPLAQLKNLTRLSDSEVRAAARAILDQRNAKLLRQDNAGLADQSAGKLPHEDRLFQDEPLPGIADKLVPPPRDLPNEYDPPPSARAGTVE